MYVQQNRGRGRSRKGRGFGRGGGREHGNNSKEEGQPSQQNWHGRGRGRGRGDWSNYLNVECYNRVKYGHYAKECKSNVECYNCGKYRHYAECYSEKKVEENANLVAEEETRRWCSHDGLQKYRSRQRHGVVS